MVARMVNGSGVKTVQELGSLKRTEGNYLCRIPLVILPQRLLF